MTLPGAFCATAVVVALLGMLSLASAGGMSPHLARPRMVIALALTVISGALLIVAAWWAALS